MNLSLLVKLARPVFVRTPLRRYVHYRYAYNFTPAQLAVLVGCIDETRCVPGDIVEVGCAAGATTCYLNAHIRSAGIEKDYYCIDTFSGFVAEDVRFEREERGKRLEDYGGFRQNSLESFEYTLRLNGCRRVCAIQADVKQHRFSAPVSFALIDVDLYQPTLAALHNIWPVLSPGAIMVIDDCRPSQSPELFDGALQACNEFFAAKGTQPIFLLDKLALYRHPA